MVDLSRLSARELLLRGHALLNANRVDAATASIFAVCERYSNADEPVPPQVLSLYALCLARQGKRKEAVDTCRMALKREPRNPACRLHMARIYLLANARRKAIEELEKGLGFSPGNHELLRFEAEMGKRRPPVIGFLSRDNPINVKLGKARAKGEKPSR
jgi:tetratricopeptide (TPR) repeat protein